MGYVRKGEPACPCIDKEQAQILVWDTRYRETEEAIATKCDPDHSRREVSLGNDGCIVKHSGHDLAP